MNQLDRIRAYFSHVVSALGREPAVHIVPIAHMVPNTVSFAPALKHFANVPAILAKPKSVTRPEYKILKKTFKLKKLSREWASDPKNVVKFLYGLGLRQKKVVLTDIGGYYSESIDEIRSQFDGAILGVLEGTENGLVKYEKNGEYETPVISVARSPLKLPEDYLVAASIVFSVEAVLREQGEILQTRSAAVIGYGRVGRAIAQMFRNRGISTSIYDLNPLRLAEAAARGFRACKKLSGALDGASLVVCATGNHSLDLKGFALLRNGAVVASVTSADDEFNLHELSGSYIIDDKNQNLVRYTENRDGEHSRSFYLVAGGNAANFLHGAVIGPAIQLIEGEKIAAIKHLISRNGKGAGKTRPFELSDSERTVIAEIWNYHFLS